mgnify:CR=1 FL=1
MKAETVSKGNVNRIRLAATSLAFLMLFSLILPIGGAFDTDGDGFLSVGELAKYVERRRRGR